jgi:hypothetical protein
MAKDWQRKRYESMVEEIPDTIYISDIEKRYLLWIAGVKEIRKELLVHKENSNYNTVPKIDYSVGEVRKLDVKNGILKWLLRHEGECKISGMVFPTKTDVAGSNNDNIIG